MTVDEYASQVMALIAAERDRGFALVSGEKLPAFYLVKVNVPGPLQSAVAEEVIRRLRDRDE